MMNIEKKVIDDLNAELKIKIGPADYESQVKDGIKKIQKKVSMPGFRPGKVPEGLVKKQYGTQVLVDEVNKLLNDSIYKYIEENKIEILGNPLPKNDEAIDFENQKDFEFTYELGLSPDFKLNLDSKLSFQNKKVKVDDELINKYLTDIKRNYGKPSNPEVSEEKDVLFIDINELEENGEIKAGGVFKSTSIGIERIKNEAAKKKLIGLKKDDSITLNADELYDTAVDKSVSLGIEKEMAEDFHANLKVTVKNISRMEDAPLDQDLFDKVYGPGVINSEEEFRNKIKSELELMFAADSDRFLFTEIENKLLEAVKISLPDNFLKKWLKAVNEKPITDEQLEKEYPSYAKSMQWKLIENKIVKDNNITVTAEEAEAEAKGFIQSEYAKYGQQATEDDLNKIAKTLLSKEKEAQRIYENLYSRKVLTLIKEKCTLDTKEVGYDEFFKNN
ncbi:MAG: trigger factor [Bacteroidia bacterium]